MQNTSTHIVSGYDEELNELTRKIAELGGVVEAIVKDVLIALKKNDSLLAKTVFENGEKADLLQQEIDEDAVRIFALRHPMATDLRRVIGAIKIAADLERVGDLAEGIARRVLNINEAETTAKVKGIQRMGRLVRSQLSLALDAFLNNDLALATQVWIGDEDIDEMYNSLFRELLTHMMEDPRKITSSTGLLFAAKNLERIGDHATNISETVHFIVTGQPLSAETIRLAQTDTA